MNDRDFDKLFGDRLNEERRFNEDDNEWTRLSARLDAVSEGGSGTMISGLNPFRRWILPLAVLLLLATSGLLWGKLTRLDNANTVLIEKINALKIPLQTMHDTVFITRVDTVFIVRNLKENTVSTLKKNKINDFNTAHSSQLIGANPNLISNSNLDLTHTSNSISNTQLSTSNPQLQTYNLQLQSKITELEKKLQVSENQQFELENELKTIKEKVNKLSLNTPLNGTELMAKMMATNDSLHAVIASIQSDSIKKLTQKITDSTSINPEFKNFPPLSIATKNIVKTNKKPTTARLFVGASGGPIFYKATWKNTQNLDVYRNEKSYQVGLKLEYALTDRLRLTASGDYCPFNFQIFWQDKRYNLPIPQHVYATVERVKSSTANQELVQAAIGTKYMFTDGTNRWRPYIGVGYSAMKILPFQTVFDIQHLATGAIRTQAETSSGTTIANLLLLNGGLEYRFSRRFVAQGEAFYDLELNRPRKTYDLFGVRGALLLNF